MHMVNEKKIRYRYVGSFPPPYGGVTNKNKMLCDRFKKEVEIVNKELGSVGKLGLIMQFVGAVFSADPLIVGLGSNKNLRILTKALHLFNKEKMGNSVVFVMGGSLHKYAEGDEHFLRCLSAYKRVYVESCVMADALRRDGVLSVGVFPNCRIRPSVSFAKRKITSPIKALYFSIINEEKGAGIALDVASALPDVQVDFWGEFSSEGYKTTFLDRLDCVPNARYCGVFHADGENVYQKISEYDLLLFPSLWKHEGVAGVLVEAKISGVPAIAFENNFNPEVIQHMVEGVVVSNRDPNSFVEACAELISDKALLKSLSDGSLRSAERYFLDSYEEELIEALTQQGV